MDNYDLIGAAAQLLLSGGLAACLIRGTIAWRDPELITQWAGDDAPKTPTAALRHVWAGNNWTGRVWLILVLPWMTAGIGAALLLDHNRWNDAKDGTPEPDGDIDPDLIQWNPPITNH